MNQLDENQRSEYWATVVSYLLIGLMMVCLTVSLSQFIGVFVPLRRSLPAWGGVIVIEAFLSLRVIRAMPVFSTQRLMGRCAEWVVLFLGIKLITELQHGVGDLVRDLPRWQENFGKAFFTGEYIGVLIILFAVWALSTLYASDLCEMESGELKQQSARTTSIPNAHTRTPAILHDTQVVEDVVPSNRRDIHNRILTRTLTVGVLMVIMIGLLRQDRITLWPDHSSSQADVIYVVLYFVFGIALFSQTNFLALRVAWGYEHATIHRQLATHWLVYSLIFTLGLGVVVFILPTHYSLGLLDMLRFSIGFLRVIIEFFIGVIMLPIILLIRLFSMLLGSGNNSPTPNEIQPVTPIQTPAPAVLVTAGSSWWDVLRSFLFWGIFITILGLGVFQYIRQNRALLSALRHLSLLGWIKHAWQWLRGQIRTARSGVRTVALSGWKKLRELGAKPAIEPKGRFMNPYRLTPRQQVIFFYYAFVRHGNTVGLPRHLSQTPYEYARFIAPVLVEQMDAVTDMTEGFMEARYSNHEVTPEQAGNIKQAWARIRRAMKPNINRPIEQADEATK